MSYGYGDGDRAIQVESSSKPVQVFIRFTLSIYPGFST